MTAEWLYYLAGGSFIIWMLRKLIIRLQLSRAKHSSITGHSRISRRLARLIPYYGYDDKQFFTSDDAPAEIAAKRRNAFDRLAATLKSRAPKSHELCREMEAGISDLQFTNSYRVPFPFRSYVKEHLSVSPIASESGGTRFKDLDGNWTYDLSGSYGVNVFGYEFYKSCIRDGAAKVENLGPVLGTYHPIIAENVLRLKDISGMDEVSFHMSGTEAVMQAVRLARYHTDKSHLVRFCGAYHGWWDGVQPGVGNRRKNRDTYTLKEMSEKTLKVLRTRSDIACVLVNPLQALHPNSGAPSDASLVNSDRKAHFDREAYTIWLKDLRQICSERGIVFIMDEILVGFRLAYGGAQEYFDVDADMVTYGKTLGGGLPVGVICGKRAFMKRFRDERPTDICFARGTFNSHPYVMGTMNEFLKRLDDPCYRLDYAELDTTWNERAELINQRLGEEKLPVRVRNLSSIWTIVYTNPSRYNWMFQYYLRAEGLTLSWVGSGRIIFSHVFPEADYLEVVDRFVAAAIQMHKDGWWWQPALDNGGIRKQIFREMLAKRFGPKWLVSA